MAVLCLDAEDGVVLVVIKAGLRLLPTVVGVVEDVVKVGEVAYVVEVDLVVRRDVGGLLLVLSLLRVEGKRTESQEGRVTADWSRDQLR